MNIPFDPFSSPTDKSSSGGSTPKLGALADERPGLSSVNVADVWAAVFRLLEQKIPTLQVRAWVQPLNCVLIEERADHFIVQFSAANDFSVSWVQDHFSKIFIESFTQVLGKPTQLEFLILDQKATPFDQLSSPLELISDKPRSQKSSTAHLDLVSIPTSQNSGRAVPEKPSVMHRPLLETNLDPRYTFESFVVGASNEFAHASALAVAMQPAHRYNPLFIYSPPGLGKTHLLHAIGNHVLSKNPHARVAYLSAERFVNELIESLQHNRMMSFRSKYRDSYDLILVDDIQFIAGKAKTEEEFFHTFNALHSSKRQIVLTSDRPPKEISGLEERIRTRFEWGLVSDIHAPEIETRIAILRSKAERDDIYLPSEVATFLATYIKSNVRELEGILIRLQAQASLTGAEISLEMAKNELKSSVPEENNHFTVENIQMAVSKHYNIKVTDLKANSRSRAVSLPRQIAMFLIRRYTKMGFKEIGQYFGGKDHTTVMHACSKIEKAFAENSPLQAEVEAIQNLL